MFQDCERTIRFCSRRSSQALRLSQDSERMLSVCFLWQTWQTPCVVRPCSVASAQVCLGSSELHSPGFMWCGREPRVESWVWFTYCTTNHLVPCASWTLHVDAYIYIHTIYIYICIYILVHIHTYVRNIYIYIHVDYVCMYVYIYIYTCIDIWSTKFHRLINFQVMKFLRKRCDERLTPLQQSLPWKCSGS